MKQNAVINNFFHLSVCFKDKLFLRGLFTHCLLLAVLLSFHYYYTTSSSIVTIYLIYFAAVPTAEGEHLSTFFHCHALCLRKVKHKSKEGKLYLLFSFYGKILKVNKTITKKINIQLFLTLGMSDS